MKEYVKPEVQYLELITEPIADIDAEIGIGGSGGYDVDLP